MHVDILAVLKDHETALNLVDKLRLPGVTITFVDNLVQAIKNVKRNQYDTIILGDKILKGDTFDVGLEIKGSKKNWQVPVICMGTHRPRTTKLCNLLSPYAVMSMDTDPKEISVIVERYLKSKEKRQA